MRSAEAAMAEEAAVVAMPVVEVRTAPPLFDCCTASATCAASDSASAADVMPPLAEPLPLQLSKVISDWNGIECPQQVCIEI